MLHTAPTVDKKALPSNREEFQFSLISKTWKSTRTGASFECELVHPLNVNWWSLVPVDRWVLELSIGGGLSLSIDGLLSLPIDVDINRAERMWVSCCELLVSHDPHGIARCSRLCRCRRSMLWKGCRSVLVEVRRSISKSGVDQHQCDAPKPIKLSTSKSRSCSFSCFTTCQKLSSKMAFTWSPFSSCIRTKVTTMSCGSVSIDVRDEVSIDAGWKISVDGRVALVDGGERVSVDEICVWVVGTGIHTVEIC
ncbi:hypothetical protein F2Q70_00027774 [Brassica cretica]|uniref:Uncharacterized protein n=1 Tax=Brassica cretica TaxID=69181 RepID=A0A8S9IFI3_BRACR|nr:hypothetical protein F2Q68_00027325 [Brassica cretica]KAF2604647.1 hypothetical protein F2Q70_00027774 [Brassica cretica]